VPAYVFALSTVALAFVLYLGWASLFKLNTVCLLCATTYVAVIALFIISAGATTFPMTSLPRRASTDVARLVRSPLGLASVAGLALGTLALLNGFPREAHAQAAAPAAAAPAAATAPAAQAPALTDQQKMDFLKWYEVQPRVTVPVDLDGAKVLVVKFNDYQCPPCRQSFLDYKPIIEKYRATGQLKFVLKHFPLERECNAAVQGDLHVASCEAAAAVVMAQSKGTADKLEEWFFANQPSLSPDKVKEGAASVAGIKDFDAQYARALTLVKTDAGLGALLGAKSTPTFIINGHVIAGALPVPYFEAAIQQEISR
jgi:protein-disulfide isomerase